MTNSVITTFMTED